MNSILNNEQYVSTKNNRNTDQPERQWIEYADGVFEPVRKNGNLNKKHHGNKRTLDWWTMDKPLDWSPSDEGKQVSLNHDYGKIEKFKAGAAGASDKEAKADDRTGKAAPTNSGAFVKSTISQGAAGLWEHEAREKAEGEKPDNSAQAARRLPDWERTQGVDPNQGSGHEGRPPSSSKDVAGLKKAVNDRGVFDLVKHLEEMRDNPPWDKEQTPLEKVQSVTHPVGKEVGLATLQELLKGSGPVGTSAGKAMGPAGILWDVVGNPDEAW